MEETERSGTFTDNRTFTDNLSPFKDHSSATPYKDEPISLLRYAPQQVDNNRGDHEKGEQILRETDST